MYKPIENMPNESKVWIYAANRPFSDDEETLIRQRMTEFTENWVTHGSPVTGSFDIRHKHFIIVAADESGEHASGCSVDSMFRVIKQLEEDLDISLLDRRILSFLIDTKVIQLPFNEIKSELNRLEGTEKKIFFNNLVENLDQLNRDWLVEPQSSWIKTYL